MPKFTLYNNVGDEIETYTTFNKATKAADKRTKQLHGAIHHVKDETGTPVYTTKRMNILNPEGDNA